MRFDDALFNWLQIQIVSNARPDDLAARDTRDFFGQILAEDHGVSQIVISAFEDEAILVEYEREGRSETKRVPREAGEQLLRDIEANPKYN